MRPLSRLSTRDEVRPKLPLLPHGLAAITFGAWPRRPSFSRRPSPGTAEEMPGSVNWTRELRVLRWLGAVIALLAVVAIVVLVALGRGQLILA